MLYGREPTEVELAESQLLAFLAHVPAVPALGLNLEGSYPLVLDAVSRVEEYLWLIESPKLPELRGELGWTIDGLAAAARRWHPLLAEAARTVRVDWCDRYQYRLSCEIPQV